MSAGSLFFDELAGQPEALRRLITAYASPEGRARLAALLGEAGPLGQAQHIGYISQSGASAEVAPVLDGLSPAARVTALTNDAGSPLARRAQAVLPLLAGDEQTVATKTFANSVAALWLLG